MDNEIWKQIKGYEGIYDISNKGRVKSLERTVAGKNNSTRTLKEKLLIPKVISSGYENVHLRKNKKPKNFTVGRLVAINFIENPENKKEVNHIDGNKTNNVVENLEWNTRSENALHSVKTGLQKDFGKNKVLKFKKSGEFVRSHNSITEAGEDMGMAFQTISDALRGRIKTAGGYVWKYDK